MKIKLKLSIEHLKNLIVFANDFLKRYDNSILFTTLEQLNLKSFIKYGFKKMIDFNNFPREKIKTYSIDVNMIDALKTALTIDYNNQYLNPLNLALYIDLQEQMRKQITMLNNSLNLHN